jgi:hypothetical protein
MKTPDQQSTTHVCAYPACLPGWCELDHPIRKEPRFRFFRWPYPYGREWQLHVGPAAVWGGYTRRMSLAVDVGIDSDRIHAHISLLWLWLSADFWWPR